MRQLNMRFYGILAILAFSFSVLNAQSMGSTETDELGNFLNEQLNKSGMLYTTPIRVTGSSKDKNTSVDIGIDTIRYVRGTAEQEQVSFDAHVDLQVPFAVEEGMENTKIKFKGKNLILSGEGSSILWMETSLSPITIQEDKIKLSISKEGTFVQFNCNGVEKIGLTGDFIFHPDFLIPVSSSDTNDVKVDTVKAHFSTEVGDWDDLLLQVTFNTPFKVKGAGDFIFEVGDAIVDFSTQSNAPDFTFPSGYEFPFEGDDMVAWTGFALKSLIVTPPSEISKTGEASNPFTFSISDMLIDEQGLTGSFMAMRKAQLNASSMNSGLNMSIDTIGVSITENQISAGLIIGNVQVPMLKNEKQETLLFSVKGNIQYDSVLDKLLYRINGNVMGNQTYHVPFTEKATIKVAEGSSLEIGNMYAGEAFGATLTLNGSLNIDSDLSIKGVRFEQLSFSTLSPHVTCKYLGLQGSADMKLGGLSLSLKELGLKTTGNGDLATLNVSARIGLMSDEMSISAQGGVLVYAAYDKHEWTTKGWDVKDIMINADFSAFRFSGLIRWYKNDQMYGHGFKGDIFLHLKTLGFRLLAETRFGSTSYQSSTLYNYWYAKIIADVSGANILLFPPSVFLKSITGGAYHRMINENFIKISEQPLDITKKPNYIPDPSMGFGFIAGVGARFASDKLVSAEFQLEMLFNKNWGLDYVSLNGKAAFMSDNISKNKNEDGILGTLSSYYDVKNKTLCANLDFDINVKNVLKGKARADIFSSPETWYFYLGTQKKPNKLEVAGFLKSQCYFMAGEIPTNLPPLNTKILKFFGEKSFSNASSSETLKGKGFAFGISTSADCGFGQKKGTVFAFIQLEGGSDAMVNFAEEKCGNWRAKGQAYVYLDGEAGVRVRKKKYKILDLTAATALYAEMPRPYYLEGKIKFKYKVLFIKGKIEAGYSAGKKC